MDLAIFQKKKHRDLNFYPIFKNLYSKYLALLIALFKDVDSS